MYSICTIFIGQWFISVVTHPVPILNMKTKNNHRMRFKRSINYYPVMLCHN